MTRFLSSDEFVANNRQLLQVGAKEADAKRQEEGAQKQQPHSPNPNHASAGASRPSQDHDRSDRRSPSPEDDSASANEWPDYRSSGSSYNQQSQHQQSGKSNGNGGKGYSVASTHDYMGHGSANGQQRPSKDYQQELWDDDKEGDLW